MIMASLEELTLDMWLRVSIDHSMLDAFDEFLTEGRIDKYLTKNIVQYLGRIFRKPWARDQRHNVLQCRQQRPRIWKFWFKNVIVILETKSDWTSPHSAS